MNNPEAPFPDSYWVISGRFAAGKYPASTYFEEETRRKLQKLIKAGFTSFFDLSFPGEMPEYDKLLLEEAGWYDVEVNYRSFPIREGKTLSAEKMSAVLDALDQTLAAGNKVYLHCLGGIGRTGMVVGCYLVRHGTAAQQVLAEIARLREHTSNKWQHSPDSDEQARMVLNWNQGK